MNYVIVLNNSDSETPEVFGPYNSHQEAVEAFPKVLKRDGYKLVERRKSDAPYIDETWITVREDEEGDPAAWTSEWYFLDSGILTDNDIIEIRVIPLEVLE